MSVRILIGDVRDKLKELPDESVHCVVTSPPYFGLRDYGVDGQIGLEDTPSAFVAVMVEVFREVRRVLRKDGTLWLNLGDSYAGSWGAQGKKLDGGLSDGQVAAHPQMVTGTGSMRRFRAGNPDKNKGNSNRDGVGRVADLKPKDLIGVPWRVAFALQADGWWLRQDIIWSKPNPMPESVTDRCTKAHEYLFLLSKGPRYHYDAAAIAEPAIYAGDVKTTNGNAGMVSEGFDHRTRAGFSRGVTVKETRNKRSVWDVASHPFNEAHFATFPPALIEPCILAGCPKGGTVLDPFGGAGTTGLVADRLGRNAILIELNPEYAEIARKRIHGDAPMFADVVAA